jgi:hypothetical protein
MSSPANPGAAPPSVSDANFIPAEFVCNRKTSKGLIRWLKPNEVSVSVQLPGRGAQSSAQRGHTWLSCPPDGDKAQDKLAVLEDLKVGKQADFTLRVRFRTKKGVTLVWSADEEPRNLAEIRELLDKVAHFPYAEALAYGQQGDQLGRSRVYGPAIQALRAGLQALGDRYLSDNLRDDSGLYVLVAQNSERAGQQDAAWTTYNTVLKSRLGAYQHLYGVVEKV